MTIQMQIADPNRKSSIRSRELEQTQETLPRGIPISINWRPWIALVADFIPFLCFLRRRPSDKGNGIRTEMAEIDGHQSLGGWAPVY
jgi:hypothetical protein